MREREPDRVGGWRQRGAPGPARGRRAITRIVYAGAPRGYLIRRARGSNLSGGTWGRRGKHSERSVPRRDASGARVVRCAMPCGETTDSARKRRIPLPLWRLLPTRDFELVALQFADSGEFASAPKGPEEPMKVSYRHVKMTGSLLDSNYTISGGRAPKRVLNNKFAAKG